MSNPDPILLDGEDGDSVKVDRVEVMYHQNGFSSDESLTLFSVDEGAGTYAVLKTGPDGWSFNDFKEVERLFRDFAERAKLNDFNPDAK